MIARAGISLADDVRACYRLATTADAPTIGRALAVVAGRRTSGTALLRSAAELRSARRDRAVVRLEAALVASPPRERAYVADLYAPLLMAERGLDDVLALLEGYVPRELRAGDHALRSMALAMAGRRGAARDHRSQSIELLQGRTILPARVWQRLATAAFFLDEPDGAIDAARRSVRLALRLHDYRTAMIARSAECSACNAIGDCEGEYAAGVDMLAFARRAGDRLLERWSLGICGERAGPLTTAEVEVLTLLGHGLSAPRIAVETNRSVHTIRAHTRSAIAKLGVSGRGAAIARARSDGILS